VFCVRLTTVLRVLGRGSGKLLKGDFQPIGVVAAVTGSIAYGVHTYDRGEIKRIEGDRKLSEQFWKAEVERYKHDLQLAHRRIGEGREEGRAFGILHR